MIGMTAQQRFDLVVRARGVAMSEKRKGKTCIMVLFPNSQWDSYACLRLRDVHQRWADQHAGLKSLPVETLILVASDAEGWDANGLALARERLRAQSGKVILITEKPLPRTGV
jgi:hypothetical protein